MRKCEGYIKMGKIKHREHKEQARFIMLLHLYYPKIMRSRLVFAVPNGGLRDKKTAVRLKAEGVVKGVSDILCLLSRQGFTFLAIEMKSKKNRASQEQEEFIESAKSQGAETAICYTAEEAYKVFSDYVLYKDEV